MSPGEGRTSKAFRDVTTVGHSSLEMRENHNGLCDEIAKDQERA
jgi:hypothetical protein